jgi:ATP-dependent DNA helicase RecG
MPPITNPDLQERRVVSRIYRNRRIGDFLKELDLTEGKSTGFPIIRDAMAANGNPEPVFYTDDQQLLFMVTFHCHPELIVAKSGTKPVTKSGTKLSIGDVDSFFAEGVDIQSLSAILDNDISDVRDYVREYIGTKLSKSVSKSMSKSLRMIDALTGEKTREEILKDLGLTNHSRNFIVYIKPLLNYGILEMTVPDKPKSRFQEYRLTEKGKKLLKK